MSAERPDVLAAAEPFVQQCGPCDFGVTTVGCACPAGDYRAVMARLMQEVERLRTVLAEAQRMAHAFDTPRDSSRVRVFVGDLRHVLHKGETQP